VVTWTVGGTMFGYCGDRQAEYAESADQHQHDRQHIRQDRVLDEVFEIMVSAPRRLCPAALWKSCQTSSAAASPWCRD